MDVLLDYILLFFRGIGNIMNAPLFNQYRCVPPRRCQKESDIYWMQRAELMPSITVEKVPQGTEMVLEKMPQEPLAILQLVDAIIDDISVNQVQSHLSPKSITNQKDTTPNKMDADSNLYDLCSEPTFCYFFIDVRSRSCSKESPEKQNSAAKSAISQCSSESMDNLTDNFEQFGKESSENPHLINRQHSLSECSDDSFICFTDDSDDINDFVDPCHSDCDKNNHNDDELENNRVEDTSTSRQTKNSKKVRFNETPKIHVMHTWNYAYRSARKGDYWQSLARDRSRFQQRITRTALILDTVLSSQHRQRIFEERFDTEK